jgi:hypothetical protein
MLHPRGGEPQLLKLGCSGRLLSCHGRQGCLPNLQLQYKLLLVCYQCCCLQGAGAGSNLPPGRDPNCLCGHSAARLQMLEGPRPNETETWALAKC